MSEAKIKITADGGAATVSDIAAISKAVEGLAERAQKLARGDLMNGIVDGIGKVGDALGASNPALAEFLKTSEEIGKSMARDGVVGAGFNAWGIVIAHVTRELQAERLELEAMQKTRADTLAFLGRETAAAVAKTDAMREQTALRQQAGRTGLSTEALLAVAEQERASKAKIDADELLRLQDIQLRNTTDHDQLQRSAASFLQAQAGAALAAEREKLAIATTADAIEKQREDDKKKRDAEALARRKENADQAKKIAEDAATFANKIMQEQLQRELDADAAFAARHKEQRQREWKAQQDEAKATRDRLAALAREDDERQAVARQIVDERASRLKAEQAQQDADIVSTQIDADIKKQEDFNAAVEGAGQASLGVLKDIVTGQGDVTKAALESKAKQAGIEAAFATGTGLLMTAVGNIPGATSAFASAAQFGAIALTASVASLAASSSAPSAAPAQASGGTSRGSGGGSGGGGGGGTTVIINGRALMTDRDVARSVAQATRAAARYA